MCWWNMHDSGRQRIVYTLVMEEYVLEVDANGFPPAFANYHVPSTLLICCERPCMCSIVIHLNYKNDKNGPCLLLESAGLLAVAMDCPVLRKLTTLRTGLFNSHDTNIWTKNPHTADLQAYQHVSPAMCGVI